MAEIYVEITRFKNILTAWEEFRKGKKNKKDVLYFALALKLKCGIWSNDKKLKEQNKVKVYCTGELLKEI